MYVAEAKELEYYSDIKNYGYKEDIKGRQTNEAPCQYLVKRATIEGYPIKKVLCITTHKVLKEQIKFIEDTKLEDPNKETAYTVFEKKIKKEAGVECEVEFMKLGEFIDENENYTITSVFENLSNHLKKCEDCQVYIDYTGGMRDISFLMTSLVRYLEFRDFKTSCVVYSSFSSVKKDGKDYGGEIYDITYIYNMMKLINGVEEFVSTGNPRLLHIFSEDVQLPQEVTHVAEAMVELSNSISLCYVDDIEEKFKAVDEALTNLSKSEIKTDSKAAELYVTMIREMTDLIRKKLKLSEGDSSSSIPRIIEWCNENYLFQQALTIIESKVPSLLCGKYIRFGVEQSDPRDVAVSTVVDNKKKRWQKRENILLEKLGYAISREDKIKYEGKGLFYISDEYDDNSFLLLQNENLTEENIPNRCESKEMILEGTKYIIPYEFYNEMGQIVQLIRLHMSLKEQRNLVNHGSGTADAPNVNNIGNAINIYLKLLNNILCGKGFENDGMNGYAKPKYEAEVIQEVDESEDKVYLFTARDISNSNKSVSGDLIDPETGAKCLGRMEIQSKEEWYRYRNKTIDVKRDREIQKITEYYVNRIE